MRGPSGRRGANFHWLDPVPATPALQELLQAATDALQESGDEQVP